ncbi:MFS transporter, partial [Streptomyces sp. NPDC058656]
ADTAREGVANALDAAPLAGAHGEALVRAARESFVDGWQNAMWAGVAVMAVLFVHVLAQGPRQTTGAPGVPANRPEPAEATAP